MTHKTRAQSRWFTGFWGKTYNPAIVDELATRDMLVNVYIVQLAIVETYFRVNPVTRGATQQIRKCAACSPVDDLARYL
jgi:hypothetical protein